MSKIRVGILGYGNLGQALDHLLSNNKNIELIGIFSKRKDIKSNYNTPVYHKDDLLKFQNKIDILALCGGSKNDIPYDAPHYSKYFNTINTFDTHSMIPDEYKKLNKIAKKHNTIAIMSAGWDPGLFSQIKAIFYSILEIDPVCFWGQGMSLGHSDAVRSIDGVVDALSFTLPNDNEIKRAMNGLNPQTSKHLRKVFVTITPDANKNQITHSIQTMPYYFANQPTTITFVDSNELNLLKDYSHAGMVIATKKTNNDNFKIHLETQMTSNPQMTAMIMSSYIKAFYNISKKYPAGAYTPLSFSPLDVLDMDYLQAIRKFC